MSADELTHPEGIARALSDNDWAAAGRGLASLPRERWAEVVPHLSAEVRGTLHEQAWAEAWAQVGRAEAMGPAVAGRGDGAPLGAIVDVLGRLVEAAQAGRADPRAAHRLEQAAADMQAEARASHLLESARAAELAAAAGDVGLAAQVAGGVLRAHQRSPQPEAAALASWVVAGLARDLGRAQQETHALVACATAARQAGDDARLAAAVARLEVLAAAEHDAQS